MRAANSRLARLAILLASGGLLVLHYMLYQLRQHGAAAAGDVEVVPEQPAQHRSEAAPASAALSPPSREGELVAVEPPALARRSSWLDNLRLGSQGPMQAILVLACLYISFTIGSVFALDTIINGWQLWTWLMCVGLTVVVLMPTEKPALALTPNWRWLLALFLAALLLRVTFLESVPGGLHPDETQMADFSLRNVFARPRETLNPFSTGPFSQPALYFYVVRSTLALVGNTITGLRLSSAVAGTLAVLATYAVVAEVQNRRAALIAAALMTTYHYHIHWSRIGLNNIWDTLWVPAMLAAYVWGWKRRWSGGAVLAGIALGLAQYFYAGNKVGILLLAYVMFELWRQERDGRRALVYIGKTLATAAVIALPIAMFALRNPEVYFDRSREVFGWTHESMAIDIGEPVNLWAFLWYQVSRSVGAFTLVPDITGFYGPGVPLLLGMAAPLFIAGIFWAIDQRQFVPVLWIAFTVLLGGIVLNGAPSSSHLVVSMPAICWLMAAPLDWLMQARRRYLALALIVIIMATDLFFYFAVYVPGKPPDLTLPFPPLPLP
jgi:4-amino-4-deoxy-L-arabinose transferase-like glycosyltransferase